MDGENNGKPLLNWDDLGVPLFLETPVYFWAIYISARLIIPKPDIFFGTLSLIQSPPFGGIPSAVWLR